MHVPRISRRGNSSLRAWSSEWLIQGTGVTGSCWSRRDVLPGGGEGQKALR